MSMADVPDFANLLRRYRRRSGLTQAELAERAGLSLAAVSLLERGITVSPQKATVDMLNAALTLAPAEAADFMEQARRARQSVETSYVLPETQPVGNLPVPLTVLIGREPEVAALLDLLGRATMRLLTLTGPAGVGKTRLALEVAATLQRERRRDVVFVGLIPVQEPERVVPAIAQALGIHEGDDVPRHESLIRALRDRPVLLILDNFEQVLPAARAVLELLIACPQVKVIVTSRSALNVRGEQLFPVAPLALPAPSHMDSLDLLLRAPTVALFLDRASAVWPDFSIATLPEGHLVAGICARLDGLPLAIELAAARIRHFGLRQLHDQLAAPTFLGMLSEGPQDVADHQRAMQSTIAWSYNLLDETEQQLFRWLGVFVGGAAVDAIEVVTGTSGDALLTGLTALVNANLLQCAVVPQMQRYMQMVTLRAYAEQCLYACGDWDKARERHAEYFIALAELSFSASSDQREGVMARVEMEYENIHAALSWAWETGATRYGLRMVGALRRFWESHAHFLEGLDWLERFIARAGTPTSREDQALLAEAWTGVLVLSHRLDRFERARDAGERALVLRRALRDRAAIARALNNLANPVTMLRDYDRAQALYEECLALYRESDDRVGMIFPLLNLGELYYEMGKPREALALYEESLALSREAGESDYARGLTWNSVGEAYIALDDPARAIEVTEPNYHLFKRENSLFFAATCAFTLGRAKWCLGDVVAARTYLDEAECLFQKLGSLRTVGRIRYVRASLALERGDVAAGRCDLACALKDLSGQSREREDIWPLVERTGTLACQLGEPERAVRLYAAAIAHRDAMPGALEPAERELRARDMNWLRATLGDIAFANAISAGEAIPADEALAVVSQVLG